MDLQLKGKLALVSGSTEGIGNAILESLLAEGASVIINGRSEKSVQEAVNKLTNKDADRVYGFAGDLSSATSADELVRKFPEIDILVNNLGIFEPKEFEKIPDEDWRRLFDINVLSGVRLSRLGLP